MLSMTNTFKSNGSSYLLLFTILKVMACKESKGLEYTLFNLLVIIFYQLEPLSAVIEQEELVL